MEGRQKWSESWIKVSLRRDLHSHHWQCSIFPLGESLWAIQDVIPHAEIILLLNSATAWWSSWPLGNDSWKQTHWPHQQSQPSKVVTGRSILKIKADPRTGKAWDWLQRNWLAGWRTGRKWYAWTSSEQPNPGGSSEASWRHFPVLLPSLVPQLQALQPLDSRIYSSVLPGSSWDWFMLPKSPACCETSCPPQAREPAPLMSSLLVIYGHIHAPSSSPIPLMNPSRTDYGSWYLGLAVVYGSLLYWLCTWESQRSKELSDLLGVTQPINTAKTRTQNTSHAETKQTNK